MIKTYIVVRNELEGFHFYPGAGEIDPRIKFLENEHRHMFKITSKIEVFHDNRELEFFLVKWKIKEYLSSGNFNHMSCEMIAQDLFRFLLFTYGDREIEVTVSEDGESDGVVHYVPE